MIEINGKYESIREALYGFMEYFYPENANLYKSMKANNIDYRNLQIDKFKLKALSHYEKKTGLFFK